MKIALFTNLLNVKSGTGNITHELCLAFKDKIDFTVFAPKNEANENYDYIDYKVEYNLPSQMISFKSKKVLENIFLPKIQNIEDFDIIHSLFAFPQCLTAARLAKKYKKPLIIGAQGTFGIAPLVAWPENIFLKWSYNQADLIITPSQFTKERIQEFSQTTTPIKIIHNGVNFERFQKDLNVTEIKKTYDDKILFIGVGALKRRKGQDIVLKALAKIIKEYPNVHYLVIGEGSLEVDLKKFANQLGVNTNVSFLGNKSGDDLVKYFKACDIYIHPARNVNWHCEGFGIVYLEAGACKKPSVAAISGGVPDAVINNQTGLMVPENDPNALAEATIKLIRDQQLRERLGQGAFEYAQKHNWDIIADQFIKEYKLLC